MEDFKKWVSYVFNIFKLNNFQIKSNVQQNTIGNIAYEITNYPPVAGLGLGNVNVVISDRKLWTPATNAFKACIVSRTDYTASPSIGCLIKERVSLNYFYWYTLQEFKPSNPTLELFMIPKDYKKVTFEEFAEEFSKLYESKN